MAETDPKTVLNCSFLSARHLVFESPLGNAEPICRELHTRSQYFRNQVFLLVLVQISNGEIPGSYWYTQGLDLTVSLNSLTNVHDIFEMALHPQTEQFHIANDCPLPCVQTGFLPIHICSSQHLNEQYQAGCAPKPRLRDSMKRPLQLFWVRKWPRKAGGFHYKQIKLLFCDSHCTSAGGYGLI